MQEDKPSAVELCLRTAANNVVAAALLWSNHRLRPMNLDLMQGQLEVVDRIGGDLVRRLVSELHTDLMAPGDHTDLYRIGRLFELAVNRLSTAAGLAQDDELVVLSDELCTIIDIVFDCAWITTESFPALGLSENVRPYWTEIGDLAERADRTYDALLSRWPADTTSYCDHAVLHVIGSELQAAIHDINSAGRTVQLLLLRRERVLSAH